MKRNAKGLEKVIANLNKEIAGIQGRSVAGLLEAGLLVQRRSQERVPVELGNLKASAYTRKASGGQWIDGKGPDMKSAGPIPNGKLSPLTVEIGYTAAYALFVHEDMEQKLKGQPRPSGKGVYWGPNGGPKFLERALNESRDDILRLVRESAEIK